MVFGNQNAPWFRPFAGTLCKTPWFWPIAGTLGESPRGSSISPEHWGKTRKTLGGSGYSGTHGIPDHPECNLTIYTKLARPEAEDNAYLLRHILMYYMARGRKTMHIDIRSRPKHNAYPIRDIINSYLARGRTTKNCNAAGVGRGKCKAPTRYYTCYPFHHGLNFTEFLYLYIYIYLFILFGISSGTEMATQRWPTILNMPLASKPLHNDASHICTQTADKKRCLQRVLKF